MLQQEPCCGQFSTMFCEHFDQYQTATRAHVAAQILAAAGRETTFEDIRDAGRQALKTAPTMWR
jgi:hypothetical protein